MFRLDDTGKQSDSESTTFFLESRVLLQGTFSFEDNLARRLEHGPQPVSRRISALVQQGHILRGLLPVVRGSIVDVFRRSGPARPFPSWWVLTGTFPHKSGLFWHVPIPILNLSVPLFL